MVFILNGSPEYGAHVRGEAGLVNIFDWTNALMG